MINEFNIADQSIWSLSLTHYNLNVLISSIRLIAPHGLQVGEVANTYVRTVGSGKQQQIGTHVVNNIIFGSISLLHLY